MVIFWRELYLRKCLVFYLMVMRYQDILDRDQLLLIHRIHQQLEFPIIGY